MTSNNVKPLLFLGLAATAAIIIGAVLFNTGQTTEQKQEAAVAVNSLVGKPLPDIKLKDKDGKDYDLSGMKGKNAVLFFNEGLMCYPACWNQMAVFGTDVRFNNDQTMAMSVIVDAPQDWQRAIAKMPDLAKAVTLFDAGGTASKQLGVLSMGSSMHAGQLPGHTYILVDKQGLVREIFDDPNMGINNEAILQKISKF